MIRTRMCLANLMSKRMLRKLAVCIVYKIRPPKWKPCWTRKCPENCYNLFEPLPLDIKVHEQTGNLEPRP
jgi:hypothetical protein